MKQFESYASGGRANGLWNTEFTSAIDTEQAALFGSAFTPAYQDDFDVATALMDLDLIADCEAGDSIGMRLYQHSDDQQSTIRFRLVCKSSPAALSDVLPLLENFGLRVLGERPYSVASAEGQNYWIHVFEMEHSLACAVNIETVAPLFEDAFMRVWNGEAECDEFNRLVLGVQIDWRAVAVLRAYSHYMKQLNLNFATSFIANTLSNHFDIASSLATLFDQRFNPMLGTDSDERSEFCKAIEESIVASLDAVENLNEDKVIRHYLTLIAATLRTNFYQAGAECEFKDYISFKFDVAAIPDAPKPRPMFEIFVDSPRLQGVHLRGGKVARGGLRWSDRHEDFRTEVLGLVKAQQVKNSVIVPVGAKGGFVCKQQPDSGKREDIQAEGVACYRKFISALLDITDNLSAGKVVKPVDVVCWDDDDPYLVVAADKGTATFSDIANEISERYGFWLGDAFASGGSVGYDHKKMGITAKGAWVSVQRHFRELGLNTQEDDFTVVGVGDMAGDVFGNGMLCSEHIRLVAAFNHLHIFVDPNPDAASSFAERKRLFEMQGSSWEDYAPELISAGGGVFSRSAKTIAITPEMQKRFAIADSEMAPNDFIKAVLVSQVDLFWNGGIGTYFKASTETHADVGDKANDGLRVNACDLKARVIGEGGNLGMTQLARSEFDLTGGRCNTDFIDNAAGVDCSDHEVNVKILLNQLVGEGSLSVEERNSLLESMTDAVSELVLENNYRQTQAISIAEHEASQRSIEFRRLVSHYESEGKLDRELEFIPSDEVLAERKASGHTMTRAELSVLVSYSKLLLKEALVNSDIASDDYVSRSAQEAFPEYIREHYGRYIDQHQLHKELVATQIAGDMVNRMGMTFSHRMQQATGECEANIAKAYVAARDLFDVDQRWREIESLDYKVSSQLQNEMFAQLIRLVRRASRWLLRSRRASLDPQQEVAHFKCAAELLAEKVEHYLQGEQKTGWEEKVARYVEAGVPAKLARYIAGARFFYNTFAIAEVADVTGSSRESAAECFFSLGERLELNWFSDQILQMGVENYWQAMARESFRDDLDGQQVELAKVLMERVEKGESASEMCFEHWMDELSAYIERWEHMMAELRCAPELDIAMFPVAIRELLDLSQASQKSA